MKNNTYATLLKRNTRARHVIRLLDFQVVKKCHVKIHQDSSGSQQLLPVATFEQLILLLQLFHRKSRIRKNASPLPTINRLIALVVNIYRHILINKKKS